MKTRSKRIVIILAVTACVVTVAILALWFGLAWQGRERAAITVRVVDSTSGDPVKDARVWITGRVAGSGPLSAVSNEEGLCTVIGTFSSGGSSDLLGEDAFVSLVEVRVSVSASGYTPIDKELAESMGLSVPFEAFPLPPVDIAIRPVE